MLARYTLEKIPNPLTEAQLAFYTQKLRAIEKESFEENVRFRVWAWPDLLKQKTGIVAKHNDEIIGFVLYSRDDTRKVFHLSIIAVHPTHRGKNRGRSLIEAIAQENPTYQIELESRPSNEPFYRKLGFKPVGKEDYYLPNYYNYGSRQVHGLFMQKTASSLVPSKRVVATSTLKPEDAQYELYRQELLALTARLSSSTSVAYGGWLALGRSKRKEKAFEVIKNELEAQGDADTKIRKLNPAEVLQTLVHNAMLIRGFGILSAKTTSGQALVKLLNGEEFKNLKALVKAQAQPLTYEELQNTTELTPQEKTSATPAPYSPYRHF